MIDSGLTLLSSRLASSFIAETIHATFLLILVALLLKLLPALSAAARSVIWTAVLLLLLVMPFLPGSAVSAAHVSGSVQAVHFAPVWSVAIASVWLLASLVRAGGLLVSTLRLRRIWASAVELPTALPASTETRHGRARTAALCLSNDVTRPSIIGFRSPRILIPAVLYPRLTASELSHIVLHEMEHLRRRDDWRNLIQKVALVLFPLNPALFWIDRRLAIERELACDESVLEATHAPRSYASCLVHLAEEGVLGRHLSLALGAWERRSELARRVHGILRYRAAGRANRSRLPAIAAIAASFLFAGALVRTPQLVTFSAPETLPSVATASLSRAPSTPFRTVALQPESHIGSHMIEAVAHMPSSASALPLKRVSRKSIAHTPRLRRVNASRPANRFVLTSWMISFTPIATYTPDAPRDMPQPHGMFAVFDPRALSPAAPQVLSADALPTVGSIIVIQL